MPGLAIVAIFASFILRIHEVDASTIPFDFSVPANYSISDATKIEVASNTARLSNQQYATDGNTNALWHLDDANGNTSTDSSVNANTINVSTTSPCAGGTFAAGKMNNSANLGTDPNCWSADDSASLSLTGSTTLEAYVKFPSAFDNTADVSKAILDKGNYRLYFDEGSGKLRFEMEGNGAKAWDKVGGADPNTPGITLTQGLNNSWRQVIPNGVTAMTIFSSTLYVGVGGSNGTGALAGMAEVWQYNPATCATCWTKVGGDGTGGSWDAVSYESVLSMAVYGSKLYAGLGYTAGDAEVWSYDGTQWDKIGGDGLNSSWTTGNAIEEVDSLYSDGTFLYAGTGVTAGDADVWRYNGSAWTKIGGDGVNSSWAASTYERVRSMVGMGGNLFVGLGDTAGDAEVWRWNGTDWKVNNVAQAAGGDALFSSWANSTYLFVASLATDGTSIYAGLGNGANQAVVWRCTNCTTNAPSWNVIGNGTASNWNTGFETVRGLAYVNSTLFASLGDSAADGEVWKYTGDGTTVTWTKVGGDAVNSSWDWTWTSPGISPTTNTKEQVFLGVNGSSLIALTAAFSTTGRAEVWSCASCNTSPTWSWIGGRNFKSWGAMQLPQVNSMTINNGKLYVATGTGPSNNQQKQATVWEYDGTTWTQVGGGNLNCASCNWEFYENVWSLASYKGDVYASMGDTAGAGGSSPDGDVWKYSSGTWTQIGGDSLNSGWTTANNIEQVLALGTDGTYLYSGNGLTAGDGDVWRWNGTAWSQIGGDGLNSGWAAATYERVNFISSYNGLVYVGLGGTGTPSATPATCRNGTDGELWRWNGAAWTKIGGDGANSSWDCDVNNAFENVRSATFVGTTLYVGLGDSNNATNSADAEVWSCSNCTNTGATPTWTRIGGDGLNGGWDDLTYEQVLSVVGYNGLLYAALGNSTQDAEVWAWNGSSWTQVGGDTINSSFGLNYEVVWTMGVYRGALLAGLGSTSVTNNASDAEVWSYGGGTTKIADSTTASWSSGTWYHVAVTYDGTTATFYKNGVSDGSTVLGAVAMADGAQAMSLGSLKSKPINSGAYGGFDGNLDEVRISNTARVSNDFVLTQYSASTQTVQPTTVISKNQIYNWIGFTTNETTNGGTITYRLSTNAGSTWKYWSGAAWATSSSTAQSNSAAVINSNISTLDPLPLDSGGLLWQAVLVGNGDQQVILNSVTVSATDDTKAPNNVSSISGNDGTWFNRLNPVFTWSTPSDDIPAPNPNSEQASGVEGYYVYFGTNASADPVTDGVFQTDTAYTGAGIPNNNTQTYYLRIKTRDNAQNVSATTFDYFRDSQAPNNVGSVSGNANSGNWYNRANPVFTWSAPTDDLPSPNTNNEITSGIKGYFVYFGTNPNAVPRTAGTFVTSPTYTAPPIDPSDTQIYYLRIQTEDKALNITSDGSIFDAFRDTAAPNNVSSVTGNAGQWFDRNNPVFTWSAPADNANVGEIASGIAGYYVYFGTNPNAVPRVSGTFITNTTYTGSPISGSDTQKYYFLIQTRDANYNTSSDTTGVLNAFIDTVVPSNVVNISGNANSGLWYDRANPVFTWTAPADGAAGPGERQSGIDGYYVYFGTNASAVPRTAGTFVTTLSYTGSPISPSDTQTYYFRIQTRDRAMNITSDSTGVLDGFRDTQAPNNVDAVTALSTVGGVTLTANTWYNYNHPYFSWVAPTDDQPNPNPNNENASGVKGYYVYFGTDHNAVPRTAGTFQTDTAYTAGTLTSGGTYYFRIQTIDNALNTTSDVSGILDAFTYKVDTAGPNGPTVSVSPAGYSAVNSYTFFWLTTGTGSSVDPAPGSGTPDPKQYSFRVGSGAWSAPTTETTITIPDAAYQEGANVFEIRAYDNIGNVGGSTTVTFYYAGSAPTAPENLTVTPSTSVGSPSANNSFAFQWDPPASAISPIKLYHFSINKLPTATNTQSTPLGGLRAAPFATQQGKNTFYVVAEDEAGNVNYDNPAHVDFYALTPAPEAPTQTQIFDISNRDTQEYAISMKWSEPNKSNGFDGYEVFRSDDGTNYVSAGTTKSPVFIDTNLASQPYYFKVRSKDNAGQYSIDSSVVLLTPTGRFTSPPKLLAPPTISTRSYSAAMTWDTDRIASSFIEYGVDQYHLGKQNGGDTVGTLDLTTHHAVSIKGLNPESTYAYRAVWVDQDGNRGESEILSFVTGLRPRISEVKVSSITLTSATISWQSTTVVSSSVKYGTTKSLGLQVDDTGNTGDKHTLRLENLSDTTGYFFGITGTDADGNVIASDIYTFNTLTRPLVSSLTVEPVRDAPTTTLKIAWKTNVPTTSIVVYGTVGAGNRTQSDATYVTDHEQVIKNMSDSSPYTIQAKSVDQYGNQATSDTRQVTTPGDTRPPKLTNLNIEVRSSGVGAAQKAQLIVTWDTDEPSSSQIEFGPGISSDNYPSRTAEDTALTNSHTVIVPELEPAKIYHLRAVARDRAGNAGNSSDTTAITGKVQRSVIDIIVGSLQNSLGFLSKLSFLQSK